MTKRLLFIWTIALSSALPMAANTEWVYEAGIMEMAMEQEIKLSYVEGSLWVSGAEGLTLEVVSLTGNKVLEVKIESPSQKVELNIPKGCYIVKVGKAVRKVSVR